MAEEQGSGLVEYALSISIVMTTVFAILSFSLTMYTNHFVANAASEGARYAMVRGASWTSACSASLKVSCVASASDISSYIKTLTPMQNVASNLVVTSSWPGTDVKGLSNSPLSVCGIQTGANSPGCVVTVSVSYSSQVLKLPFISMLNPVLKSSSTITIVE